MVRYESVGLPFCEPDTSPAELLAGIDRWITSAPMRDLVHLDGGELPTLPTGELLTWLDGFSATHWDRRAGRERHEAVERDLTPEDQLRVLAAARALGLVDARPPRHDGYHHVIVLGGLARACLQRTAYTAHLLRDGGLGEPEIGALGSSRPLNAQEDELLAARQVTGCGHEMDVMDAGIRRYLGFDAPHDERTHTDPVDPHRSWSVRCHRSPDGRTARVLAAPTTDDSRRANTADTQEFWARQVTLTPGDRVLVVTSAIYVPFQHVDAVRTLGVPYRCGIDTVGVDAGWGDDPLLRQPVSPGRYLQEIRSGIRSMLRLFHTLRQPTPAG